MRCERVILCSFNSSDVSGGRHADSIKSLSVLKKTFESSVQIQKGSNRPERISQNGSNRVHCGASNEGVESGVTKCTPLWDSARRWIIAVPEGLISKGGGYPGTPTEILDANTKIPQTAQKPTRGHPKAFLRRPRRSHLRVHLPVEGPRPA